jgi:hypothetical protein
MVQGSRLYPYLSSAKNVAISGFGKLGSLAGGTHETLKGFFPFYGQMVKELKNIGTNTWWTNLGSIFGGAGGGFGDIFGKGKNVFGDLLSKGSSIYNDLGGIKGIGKGILGKEGAQAINVLKKSFGKASGVFGDLGGIKGITKGILGKEGGQILGKGTQVIGNLFETFENLGGIKGVGKGILSRAGGMLTKTGSIGGLFAEGGTLAGLGSIFAEGGALGGLGAAAGGLFAEGGTLAGLGAAAGGLFAEGGLLGGLGAAAGGLGSAVGGLTAFGLADIWNPLGWAALIGAGGLAAGSLLSGWFGKDKKEEKKRKEKCVHICGFEDWEEKQKKKKEDNDPWKILKDATGIGGIFEIFQGDYLKGIWDMSIFGRISNTINNIFGLHKDKKKRKCLKICGLEDEDVRKEHQMDITQIFKDATGLGAVEKLFKGDIGGALWDFSPLGRILNVYKDIIGDEEFQRQMDFARDWSGMGGVAEVLQGKVGQGLWDMSFIGKGMNLYKKGHIGEQPISEQIKFWKDYTGIGGFAELFEKGKFQKGLWDMSPWGRAKNTYADMKRGQEASRVLSTKEILVKLLQQSIIQTNLLAYRAFGVPFNSLSRSIRNELGKEGNVPGRVRKMGGSGGFFSLFKNPPQRKYENNKFSVFENLEKENPQGDMLAGNSDKTLHINEVKILAKDDPEETYQIFLRAIKTWERQLEES